MFNYICGKLVDKSSDQVVIENGGIGWQIHVPATVFARLPACGEEIKLFTYLVVREDALQLYGFLSPEDLTLFKLLQTVSGIGPKVALSVLSTLSPAEFFLAITHENIKTLTRVPGIGNKSARRLIVELKDKVAEISTVHTELPAAASGQQAENQNYQDALAALIALGYNGNEAQAALQSIDGYQELNTQDLIKKALVRLGSQ
ncbi:MAG: Holliday junction branch migration protein RuvA [Firmicutes bacterium]|nr:Holliday junction branch migration protein RuvA [Bacillota bacterium]